MNKLNMTPQNLGTKILNPDASAILRQAILDNNLLGDNVDPTTVEVSATRGGFNVTAQAIAEVVEDATSDTDNSES